MGAVVKAERQALKLGEEVEPVLVGDLLADPLRLVVGEAGEQPACGGGEHDEQGDRQKRVAGVVGGQSLRGVDRPAEQPRQRKACDGRAQACAHGQDHAPRRPRQCVGDDPAQDARHGRDVDRRRRGKIGDGQAVILDCGS